MSKKVFAIVLTLSTLYSCESIFYKEEPGNTFEENFEIFWSDFDKYYAQFQIRDIDWDSVYNLYQPIVNTLTSENELFNILAEIIGNINDGHVNLFSPLGNASCKDCFKNYTSSRLINPLKYIIGGQAQEYGSIIEYRNMIGGKIGYIMIKTFKGAGEGLDLHDERYLIIDDILEQFKDKEGIIIDVRANSGGNSVNAETIAGRFADQKRLFHRFYQKNGSGKNDFSNWYDVYIEPKGSYQYKKPVVVLTSRRTFSSAEIFVMAMEVFPHVTIVGDTTGGGIGNPIFRELPNGWVYRLSTKVGATANSYIIEGNGITPDSTVLTTKQDSTNGIDRMLEKAIEILNN